MRLAIGSISVNTLFPQVEKWLNLGGDVNHSFKFKTARSERKLFEVAWKKKNETFLTFLLERGARMSSKEWRSLFCKGSVEIIEFCLGAIEHKDPVELNLGIERFLFESFRKIPDPDRLSAILQHLPMNTYTTYLVTQPPRQYKTLFHAFYCGEITERNVVPWLSLLQKGEGSQ